MAPSAVDVLKRPLDHLRDQATRAELTVLAAAVFWETPALLPDTFTPRNPTVALIADVIRDIDAADQVTVSDEIAERGLADRCPRTVLAEITRAGLDLPRSRVVLSEAADVAAEAWAKYDQIIAAMAAAESLGLEAVAV